MEQKKEQKPEQVQNGEAEPVQNTAQNESIFRTCRKCTHKWLGKPNATKCPKCRKYIGKAKEIKDTATIGGIKVETVDGVLPPLPTLSETTGTTGTTGTIGIKQEKKPEAPTIADIPADTYTNIAGFPFDLVANAQNKPYWKLTNKEKESLAPLLKKVGDKWIGKWFEKYPDEGALAIVAIFILMGKFTLEMQYKKNMQKQQKTEFTFKPEKQDVKKQAQGGDIHARGK